MQKFAQLSWGKKSASYTFHWKVSASSNPSKLTGQRGSCCIVLGIWGQFITSQAADRVVILGVLLKWLQATKVIWVSGHVDRKQKGFYLQELSRKSWVCGFCLVTLHVTCKCRFRSSLQCFSVLCMTAENHAAFAHLFTTTCLCTILKREQRIAVVMYKNRAMRPITMHT